MADITHTPEQDSTRLLRTMYAAGLAVLFTMLAAACGGSHLVVGADGAGSPIGEPRPEFVTDMAIDPVIELGGDVGLTPGDKATITSNENGTMTIVGSVEVPTATGPVPIDNARVIVETDPVTGESSIVGGTGTVPFPLIGELEGSVINHLPEGIIGVAYGRDLHHLGAHVVDDREYLYFHFDGGLDIDLPFAGRPGYEALPPGITVPTGKSATFVLDPTDPYFYIGGACPQSSDDGDDRDDADHDDDAPNDNGMNRSDSTESAETLYTIEAADLPPGEECGFGFSLAGNIPAPAVAGGSSFSGHIVLDGIIPLYAGIELDGSTLVSFEQGVRTVGWGDVVTSIPLLPELLDIQIPLGDASVDLQAQGERIGIAIEGMLGAPEQIVLPFDIPVRLPNNGSISFSAGYGIVPDAAGRAMYDPASHVVLGGTTSLGLGHFGAALGIDLSDIASSESTIQIDQTGVRITGNADLSIHPSLQTDAASVIEAFISTGDPAATYLTGTATVRVFGTDLSAATIDLDRTGLFVHGLVTAGGLGVEVGGQITDQGADISGRTELEIALDGLADVAQGASNAVTKAIAEVERLDQEIDATRDQVRAELRARDQGFVTAQKLVDDARADLDEINDTIRSNNRRIDRLRKLKADEKDRFDDLRLGQQALQLVSHEAKLTGWNAEIAALKTANTAQEGYLAAAQLALTGASESLRLIEAGLNEVPVDADPRIIALVAARDTAVAALELARSGADAFTTGGIIRGEIEVSVGSGGVSGSFVGELCNGTASSCTLLTGGRVEYFPSPTLCIDIFGTGEVCLAI